MPGHAGRSTLADTGVVAAVLLALLTATPAPAQQTPVAARPPVGVGPFRLGMSLDEVRAAAPQIAWRDVRVSRLTGRVFSIRSDDTLPIAGIEFEVGALAHYYLHGLSLEGVTRVADAAACEQAGVAVLAALEPQAGPFASHAPRTSPPSAPALQWNTQRSASGSLSVVPSASLGGSGGRTAGETVRFGAGSTALVEAFDSQYRSRSRQKLLGPGPAHLRLSAFNHGADYSVQADVEYGGSGESNCAVRVELERWTQPPLPQTFDTAQAKTLGQLSVAERHLVQAPDAAGGAALDVELLCDIDRSTGWTFNCGVVRPDGISAAQEAVAQRMARLAAFDMSGVDRDDPQMMRGTVRVRVDPADRKPIDFLDATRTPVHDVEFEEQPAEEDDAQVLPPLPTDAGNEVEVPLTCRIQGDGSLICAGVESAVDAERRAVVATACRLAGTRYRAAPSLRSGAPSAGRVIDLTVRVQPQF